MREFKICPQISLRHADEKSQSIDDERDPRPAAARGARRRLLPRPGPRRRDHHDAGLGAEGLRSPGAALQHLRPHDGSAVRARCLRPVPHVRVGHHEARGRVELGEGSPPGEDRGARLGDVDLRHRHRSEGRAAAAIDKNPAKYAHYLVQEAGGMLGLKTLNLARILNAPPEPYTKERFQHTYEWTRDWALVPAGATYENTVDNRAWQ